MPCTCAESTKWESSSDEWKRPDVFVGKNVERPATWDEPSASRSAVVRLMDAMRRSLPIAELEDDWDGEGSPGYSSATLNRALEFLMRNIGVLAPPPQINPGDKGSIDLYWEDESRHLLINFPPGNEEPSYYGEDRSGSTTGGVIRSGSMERQVAGWLFKAGR